MRKASVIARAEQAAMTTVLTPSLATSFWSRALPSSPQRQAWVLTTLPPLCCAVRASFSTLRLSPIPQPLQM